ncbi:Site-specific DNA recombinase [Paenibacillus sp. OV219]|nr:Site-specific DNA recombinase [Paenibacillus sp. OV219]
MLQSKNQLRDTILRIAIYLRVSSDEQAKNGEGLDGQLFKCKQWIQQNHPNAVITMFSDEGISADKIPMHMRHGLGKMMSEARKGQLDLIVTFKYDRLARKVEESETIYNQMDRIGVPVWDISGDKKLNQASSADKLTRQILASVAEMEISNTKERIRAVKENQRATGKFAGGELPYGFRWNAEEEKIVEIEEEIRVWLSIIHKYMNENKGTVVIAKELNEEGISFTKGKKGHGRSDKWDKENVRNLLKNPTICGRLANGVLNRYYDADGKPKVSRRPPREWTLQETPLLKEIVPLDVWYKIIERMEQKRSTKVSPKQMATSWLLSGVIKCTHCGSQTKTKDSGVRKSGKSFRYYVCSNTECDNPTRLRKEDIEHQVLSELQGMFTTTDKQEAVELAVGYLSTFGETKGAEISTMELQLDENKAKLNRVESDYVNGDLSAKAYSMAVERIDNLIEELTTQLEAKRISMHAQQQHLTNISVAMEVLSEYTDIAGQDDPVTFQRKRAVVLQLVDHITVVDGEPHIVLRAHTGSEVPAHLQRMMDGKMEQVMKEVITGSREVSAASAAWVNTMSHRYSLMILHPVMDALSSGCCRMPEYC